MSSLQAHLERHDLAVNALEFRRDCPLCRAERVYGQLPSASLVPPRACAAMTAAVLAASAVAPGAAAAVDGQGVAASAPESPPPPQVSDVAVGGGGGAAPVDGDHGAQQERAHADDQGADSVPRPSERAPETGSGSGAVAPSGVGASNPEPTAQPDGDSAGSGDAATVQPAPAAEPAGDSAPAGRPDEPDRPADTPGPAGRPDESDRPADTPGPAAAPAPSQDEPAAPAPSHAPSDTGRGTLSPGPPASPASGQAVGADHSGGSEEHRASGSKEHAASTSGRRSSSNSGGTAGGDRGGARDADGSTDRGRRTARDGEVLVADATATRSDRAGHRAEREETERPAIYRVRPGDSLWRIAGRHLGSDATVTATAQEVTRLWELNRQRIGTGNPDLIFPGQTLRM
jgi:LysM domain